jgi:TIR domain
MRRFDDSEVNSVAGAIAAANPLTLRRLVHELDRLFNRMAFRYEPTWQCRTQNWDRRLHAAMQTWRLLEDTRTFVRSEGSQYYGVYDSLVRDVYRYCDYMATYLFKSPANLSSLKEATGNDEQFLSQLPEKIHFTDLEAERNVKIADEPRVLAIQHMNALMEAFSPNRFDVFLSHAHGDKPMVRELKRHLVEVPLRVWLDEDELRPGVRWQDQLEAAIKNSSSVVVTIGPDGEGPWEKEEIRAAVDLAVKDGRPVIPVLLPGAPESPDLHLFLRGRTWVDMRQGITPQGVGKLVFGITGIKPHPQ